MQHARSSTKQIKSPSNSQVVVNGLDIGKNPAIASEVLLEKTFDCVKSHQVHEV